MPTVFLAQMPSPAANGWVPDFSHAKEYGPIVPVFEAGDQPSLGHQRLINKAYEVLKDATEHDYICYVPSDGGSLLIIGYVLAQLGLRKINFLRYEKERDVHGDRKKGRGFYVPATLQLNKGVNNYD